jgi:hypothetical protein
MRDDHILDVSGIELGEELLAEAFYSRLYIARGKRLLAILSKPGAVDVLSSDRSGGRSRHS